MILQDVHSLVIELCVHFRYVFFLSVEEYSECEIAAVMSNFHNSRIPKYFILRNYILFCIKNKKYFVSYFLISRALTIPLHTKISFLFSKEILIFMLMIILITII